jgi:hypothetical protein
MTCHEAREEFSALIDDALDASGRAALEAHLATCADCRRDLQRFRDTVSLVRAVTPVRAPAGFVDRVLEAARPVPWPRRLLRGLFLPWPVKLPMEAAAIVLVAVGVAVVYRGTPELEQASRYKTPASMVARSPETTAPQEYAAAGPRETAVQANPAPESERAAAENVQRLAKTREAKEAPEPGKQEAPAAPAPGLAPQTETFSRDTESRREIDRRALKDIQPPVVAEERAKLQQNVQAARPEPGARADTSLAPAPRAQAPAGAALSFVPPSVSGRLEVGDRAAALIQVSGLIARLGATENRRVDEPNGSIVELTIPREAYPELTRELARLGRWRTTREPAELPAQVRVVLQITS